MSDLGFPPNFFPVLQTPDWPGKPHCPTRPLPDGTGEDYPLLVSWAVVDEIQNMTLTNDVVEQNGFTIEQLEEAANHNWMEAFGHAEWETLEPMPGISLLMARSELDAFSSGIVCSGLLEKLHDGLGEDMIYVAVPDRFSILAATGLPNMILPAISGMYNDAVESEMGALSTELFISMRAEGKVVGTVQLQE